MNISTETIEHTAPIPDDLNDETGRPIWVDRESWRQLMQVHHRLRKLVTILMRECTWGDHKLAPCHGVTAIRGREICCEPESDAARLAHERGHAVDLAVFAGWHAIVGPSGSQLDQIARAIGTWSYELDTPVRFHACASGGPFHLELRGLPTGLLGDEAE